MGRSFADETPPTPQNQKNGEIRGPATYMDEERVKIVLTVLMQSPSL